MLAGEVVSLQVGTPSTLQWRGNAVPSAIIKNTVQRPTMLGRDGFDGDQQADLRVHGGPDKAACCYPIEHHAGWRDLLGDTVGPGAFGENLSLRGLLETDVYIGDVFRAGEATVQVSQPRGPCFKLAARWGVRGLPGRMAREGISGFYLRVLEGGRVGPGDAVEQLDRPGEISVAEVMRVTYRDRADVEAIERLIAAPLLAEQWRAALRVLLERSLLPLRDFGTD